MTYMDAQELADRLTALEARIDQLAMGVAMLLGYRPAEEAARERKEAFRAAHECWTSPVGGLAYSRCSCGWECKPMQSDHAQLHAMWHLQAAATEAGVVWP